MTSLSSGTLCVLGASAEVKAMIEALLRPYGWAAGGGKPSLVVACGDDPVRAGADAAALYPGAARIVLSGGMLPPDGPRIAYLPIPFPLGELPRAAARVTGDADSGAVFDEARRTLTAGGKTVRLSTKECGIVRLLLGCGEPVPRETVEALFPLSKDKSNACRVAVALLRRKLDGTFGAGTLTAVREKGYILRIPD